MAELTAALKATECEVKAKIKSIRAQYTREKQKSSKVKTGTGTDEVYVSKWPHLEQLKFLDDFIIAKKSISNLLVNLSSGCCLVAQVVVVLEVLDLVASYQINVDEEVSDVHVEEQEDDTQSDMNTSSTAQSTRRPTSSGTGLTKRQKKESQEDELMKRAIACMEKVGDRNSKQDDDDVFGLFVASELRSISDPQCKNWDSKNFLQIVESTTVPDDCLLVTMDVTSLYTNIDQTEGIQCTLKYVREHQELVPTYVPNGVLRKLLELVLQHNVFDFNGTTYRQKYGTAMGTSLAPPFAILYMASLEEPFLQSRRLKPLLFKRYIDDIFMIWPHGLDELKTFVQEFNNLRPRIKLTFEASQTAANFLDTTVYKGRRHRENGHLDIKPFFKSTNSMHYLHFTSNHPKSVFKGIVVGEALCSRGLAGNPGPSTSAEETGTLPRVSSALPRVGTSMVPTAHGQKMWTGGVFVTYQAEYQKIGILQMDCRSHISTLIQFKEAGVTPKGLTLKIPCTVKMPTAETSHRWEETCRKDSPVWRGQTRNLLPDTRRGFIPTNLKRYPRGAEEVGEGGLYTEEEEEACKKAGLGSLSRLDATAVNELQTKALKGTYEQLLKSATEEARKVRLERAQTSEQKLRVVSQKCAIASKLLSQLEEVGSVDPQVALLLLRQCGSFCKLVHLARSTPPSLIAEGLEYFDNDVRHCFALSTAVDTTNSAWKQAQLSLSRGGLGLRRLSEHSSACYIASLSMAGMCSESNRHLLNAINQFNEHVSNEEMVTLEAIRETPCSQKLEPSEFQAAIQWWLSVDISGSRGATCPHCTAHSLDPLGHHALTCKHGGDVVICHNRLQDVFAESCRRACISAQVEVGYGSASEERHTQPADVLAANWMMGKPAAFDFTVTSPLTSSNLPEASVTAGSAAFAPEERKHKANDSKCAELGWNCPKSAAVTALYQRLSMTLVRANVRALLSRTISDAGY
eukprot:Em0026g12a